VGAGSALAIPEHDIFASATGVAVQSEPIPADVCFVDWILVGGSGGYGAESAEPGLGGRVEVRLPVVAGSVIDLLPGQQGSDAAQAGSGGNRGGSNNGGKANEYSSPVTAGGGGGASAIRVHGTTALLAEAGGGGGAGWSDGGSAGAEGEDGQPFGYDGTTANGGGGATAEGGGAGGTSSPSNSYDGGPGMLGTGGSAGQPGFSAVPTGAGGGGGGHYGGGAGASLGSDGGAGGGGGSNFAPAGATLNGTADELGNGWIAGDYVLCGPTKTPTTPNSGSGSGSGNETGNGGSTTPEKIEIPAPTAPRDVAVTSERASLVVSWKAPTSGASKYRVTASPGNASCETTELTCRLGATAGETYEVTVVALGKNGVAGPGAKASATAQVAAPVVPATVPVTELTLTTDKGIISSLEVGEELTVVGTGFLPYSTATIVIYSTPTVLGTVQTDGAGNFSKAVTVPKSLAAGRHTLIASGVAPDGTDRFLKMAVTVDQATSSAKSLAFTGASIATPVLGGLVALVAGSGLLVISRRRAGN
jgi:hypothetical protein